MCQLKDLQDGTYSIDQLADMHEALDMRDEVVRMIQAKSGAK
jgi:hypothetical protein